jgi:putative ABC transport system substrate-binding protein
MFKIITTVSAYCFLTLACWAKSIGIIQVIEHPALDSTRAGIIKTLSQKYPDLKITWQSAQGNMATAVQIAQTFAGKQVDCVVALGTTPAQAAVNVCKNQNIPVIYASVTDPKSAGLIDKAAGITNFVDVTRQMDAMLKFVPNMKTLGIIYNPGEANSEQLLKLTQDECTKRNIQLKTAIALKVTDVRSAAQKLIGSVDAIFVNNDNTALAGFACIAKVANEVNLPLFASDADLINQGAWAVLGPDQYEIGVQTAEFVSEILDKKLTISDLGIGYPRSVNLYTRDKK